MTSTPAVAPVRLTQVNQRRLTTMIAYTVNGWPVGGSDLWRHAGGFPGRAHLFLWRLEAAGWVTAEWETPEPASRRARRLYRLTPDGIDGAEAALGGLGLSIAQAVARALHTLRADERQG